VISSAIFKAFHCEHSKIDKNKPFKPYDIIAVVPFLVLDVSTVILAATLLSPAYEEEIRTRILIALQRRVFKIQPGMSREAAESAYSDKVYFGSADEAPDTKRITAYPKVPVQNNGRKQSPSEFFFNIIKDDESLKGFDLSRVKAAWDKLEKSEVLLHRDLTDPAWARKETTIKAMKLQDTQLGPQIILARAIFADCEMLMFFHIWQDLVTGNEAGNDVLVGQCIPGHSYLMQTLKHTDTPNTKPLSIEKKKPSPGILEFLSASSEVHEKNDTLPDRIDFKEIERAMKPIECDQKELDRVCYLYHLKEIGFTESEVSRRYGIADEKTAKELSTADKLYPDSLLRQEEIKEDNESKNSRDIVSFFGETKEEETMNIEDRYVEEEDEEETPEIEIHENKTEEVKYPNDTSPVSSYTEHEEKEEKEEKESQMIHSLSRVEPNNNENRPFLARVRAKRSRVISEDIEEEISDNVGAVTPIIDPFESYERLSTEDMPILEIAPPPPPPPPQTSQVRQFHYLIDDAQA
jgi:hypothetical protein